MTLGEWTWHRALKKAAYYTGMNRLDAPDWSRIDLILLDMDGTFLDLSYDNRFWNEVVPAHYARVHGMDLVAVRERLTPWFAAERGQLAWYRLDHWSTRLQFDVIELKRQTTGDIRPLPGAKRALQRLSQDVRPMWIATNAHPATLALKMEATGLIHHFDRAVTSHALGAAKESVRFWEALQAEHRIDPARTLFVDDNPSVVDAARAFGIDESWLITRPSSEAPPAESAAVRQTESLAALVETLPAPRAQPA